MAKLCPVCLWSCGIAVLIYPGVPPFCSAFASSLSSLLGTTTARYRQCDVCLGDAHTQRIVVAIAQLLRSLDMMAASGLTDLNHKTVQ